MIEILGDFKKISGNSAIIFDTSSLVKHSSCSNGGNGNRCHKRKFLHELIDSLNDGREIFITEEVLKEYLRFLKGKSKWMRPYRKLIDSFNSNGRIFNYNKLQYSEQKEYKRIEQTYYHLAKRHKLHGADFGLFVTGVIFSKTFPDGAGLITNDKGIRKTIKDFLDYSPSYSSKLWTAEREDINLFKKVVY